MLAQTIYIYDKTCDTICIHFAHGIFVENQIFLKTMKSHCTFRIITVDNLYKIENLEIVGNETVFKVGLKF